MDEFNNQQIIGVDIDSETVTIEHGNNEYNLRFKDISVEILIDILQAIEDEDYEESGYKDEEK